MVVSRAWVLAFALCAGCAFAFDWRLAYSGGGLPDCAKPGEVPPSGGCVRALLRSLLPGILHNAYSDTATGGGLPVAGAEFTALCKKAGF